MDGSEQIYLFPPTIVQLSTPLTQKIYLKSHYKVITIGQLPYSEKNEVQVLLIKS